jgi:nucleolar protein 14
MKLDADFESLRSLLYAPVASVTDQSQTLEPASVAVDTPQPEKLVSAADETYDRHVRELAFDQRAKPKDRTKTEEEVALEEKEALEKAERNRRRRMLGEAEESDEDEGGKGTRTRKKIRGGDDLEDDFMDQYNDDYDLGEGLGDDDGLGLVDGEGLGNGKNDSESSDTDEEASILPESVNFGEASSSPEKPGKTRELPFTFPCPSNHFEFLEIVQGLPDKDVPIVIKRIKTLYHPSLAPGNKQKMEVRIPAAVFAL